MDLRPQSHEIIRTWAFYTIAKALLHEGTIPWRHAAISGWVLDPDRKKMSKSKGNVVTPMHLLDQYGADAVRYWSLSAKLGTDTAFDEKVLKVGRRLVVKLFNAAKFVLAQSGPDGPVSRALDRGFLAACATWSRGVALPRSTLSSMRAALELVERFFWAGFTDTYVEMVKARARSEEDRAGARPRPCAALRLGLRTLLRLFAPFLPYITEEAWSWRFGARRPAAAASTGRRGPGAHEFDGPGRGRRRRGRLRAPRSPSWRPCTAPRAAAGASVGRPPGRCA